MGAGSEKGRYRTIFVVRQSLPSYPFLLVVVVVALSYLNKPLDNALSRGDILTVPVKKQSDLLNSFY